MEMWLGGQSARKRQQQRERSGELQGVPSELSSEHWSAHECKKPCQAGTPPDGVRAGSSALACTNTWAVLVSGGGRGAVLRIVGYLPAFLAPTHLLILAPPAMTTNYVSWEGNCHLLGTTGLEGVIPRAHTGPRTV